MRQNVFLKRNLEISYGPCAYGIKEKHMRPVSKRLSQPEEFRSSQDNCPWDREARETRMLYLWERGYIKNESH